MSKGRQAALGFIFVTLLIDTIGFGVIIPVMPSLIMELTHTTTSEASRSGGWLIVTFPWLNFYLPPF
jgi:MFS transporter, DHA1 family, tetracycline resistance protein